MSSTSFEKASGWLAFALLVLGLAQGFGLSFGPLDQFMWLLDGLKWYVGVVLMVGGVFFFLFACALAMAYFLALLEPLQPISWDKYDIGLGAVD